MSLNDDFPVKLQSPEQLLTAAQLYLIQGNELEEAHAMSRCSIEIGELYCIRGTVKEINITLRCTRDLFERLKPTTNGFSEEETPLMARLKEAVRASLPSGYDVANIRARVSATDFSLPQDFPEELKKEIDEQFKKLVEARAAAEKEMQERYLLVPLVRARTGRPILTSVASSHSQLQDYPDTLTPEQTEVVGWILEFLRDYADIHDDLAPTTLMAYETEVSAKLEELNQLGLGLFTGRYRIKKVFEKTGTYWIPVTVIAIVPTNNPRIEKQLDGTEVMKAAIPRRSVGNTDGDVRKETSPATDGADAALGVTATVEGLTAEMRELRKALFQTSKEGAGGAGTKRPRDLFQKAGSFWKIVFDGGEEFFIDDTLGAKYLNFLLHHPNEVISAYDLELAIQPEKATARQKNSVQGNLDTEAVKNYLRELNKLRAKRESAASEGNNTEVGQLDAEISDIETELKRKGTSGDVGERARGNVSKAIAAIRQKLLKGDVHEKAFGAHLQQFVSTGYECAYIHPPGRTWN
jgi:hypothetical protein